MSDLKFEIDVNSIASEFGEIKKEVAKDLKQGVSNLASMTHAKTLELADEHLNSLSKMYKDNVSFQQIEDNIWVVSLDEKALWIEEGRKCVVYGNNKDHIPKVLTPDGEIPITELKVGMLVLNQYGKWTDVVEIYDEHLVEKSKLKIQEIKTCRYAPENTKLHKRKYSLGFVSFCPTCKDRKMHKKMNNKTINNSYCTKCLEKEEVYKVEVSGHLNANSKSKNWSTMYLTGDHRVMTQDGWKEIKDFISAKDSLKVPSWGKCKTCNKNTFFGNNFCYDKEGGKCSSSFHVNNTLKQGKHQCQKPDHRAKYLKILKKIHKGNKTEQKLEDLIKKTHSCLPWGKDEKADFFREYPVRVKSDGKYKDKYYYIDFYSPELNLAIEVDGKAFHCNIRDNKRDRLIKERLNCDIIRIPAKNVWKKNFYEKTLTPILKNHTDEIKMLDFSAVKVSRKYLKKSSPINRRWDITVRDGESFVCNKVLIHNSGFMDELLNGKSAKTGKDGKKYAVIPFEHSKNPSEQSSKARELTNQIKSELKRQGVNYRKPEYNPDGSPKLGLIKRFNVDSAKLKPTDKNSPLQGVAIYQRMEGSKVKRDVMTFRVISEKHREEGKWVHPGRPGDKLMDKAFDWAMTTWENEILPDILGSYDK